MSHLKKVREGQKRNFIESAVIGLVLTALSYVVGILAGWLTLETLNWLEVFAVFTAYGSTYLCVRERRINYPVGAISSAAFAILFIQSGLFASAVLNAYLVPTLVYGWFRWRRDEVTRPVMHVSLKMIPVYLGIAGAGYAGAALISQKLGGAMAWTDSVILAATILAQFMLDNKKLENWIVWAVVNVFAIYTYATTGLPLVAFQYVFFLANTIYGYYIWNRSMNHGKVISTADGDAADLGTLAADSVR
jgi:nicotinamide mononucleotide transporter